MKTTGKILAFLVAAALLAAVPASASGKTLVRMEGWVVDSFCGRKNANEEGKACVIECAGKGAKLVFASKDGNLYELENQEKALEHVGLQLGVFGTLDENRVLTVGKYIVPGEKGGKSPLELKPEGTMKPGVKREGGDRGGDQ